MSIADQAQQKIRLTPHQGFRDAQSSYNFVGVSTRPLPLVCALYAVENSQGVWLCAYYGANRSVFDYLPQKDAEIDEARLGIAFLHKVFIPQDRYQPAQWEQFKKERFMAYGAHGE